MAITYATYLAANYANAAAKAKEALEASGFFDSVALDAQTNTVTCSKNNSTVFALTYGSGKLNFTFGAYASSATEITSFWIGACSSGVYVGFIGYGGSLYGIAVYRSTEDRIMLTYRNALSTAVYTVAQDNQNAPENSGVSATASLYYSTLCALCSMDGTDALVSTSSGVYRFVSKLNTISTTVLSIISIAGKSYLTDGYLCIADV